MFWPCFPGLSLKTVFFRKSAFPKIPLFLPVFWRLPIFFQITIFDFNSIFALAVGSFFVGFRPKRVFQKCRPSRKRLDFACVLAFPDFFFKSRFSTLTPFLRSPSGRFFADFRPKRVCKNVDHSENSLILPVFWCLPFFFQITIFDFNSVFALAVGSFFCGFSSKTCFPKCRPSREKLDFACVLVSPDFFFKSRFSTLTPCLRSLSLRVFVFFVQWCCLFCFGASAHAGNTNRNE